MMSDVVAAAVDALNEKLGGNGFDGIAKFEIEDEGAIVMTKAAHAQVMMPLMSH